MNAKRILALLFAVLMVAGCLAACGETKPATTDPAGTQPAGTTPATTFVPWSAEDIADMGANIQTEANGNKITLKVWQPEAAQDVFKAQVAKFQEIFKDYAEIEIEVAIQGEGDAGAAVISDPNTAADVFGFASDQIMKLAKPEAITEIVFKPVHRGYLRGMRSFQQEIHHGRRQLLLCLHIPLHRRSCNRRS